MHIIVCLDDRNGMLFNHRRQSQDKTLRKYILELTGEQPLWMNAYSAGQFENLPGNVRVDENFLEQAKPGEYCFVENCDVLPAVNRIESCIVYRWNRLYPADTWFPEQLLKKLCSREDFAGNSHETITREVYSL